MYWWADFDAGEVREEFAMIRELGLTHIRFFLLWENFQPAPDRIDPTAMGNLRSVCDTAADLGLKLAANFFHRTYERPELGSGLACEPPAPRARGEAAGESWPPCALAQFHFQYLY